jgi:hypothetical protein
MECRACARRATHDPSLVNHVEKIKTSSPRAASRNNYYLNTEILLIDCLTAIYCRMKTLTPNVNINHIIVTRSFISLDEFAGSLRRFLASCVAHKLL